MTGWTNGGNSSDTGVKENGGGYATTNCDGKFVYNTWWKGTPLTQTLQNLPQGSYTLTAILASSDGNLDGKVFMEVNETRQLFTFPVNTGGIGVKCSLPFTMAEAGNAKVTVIGGNDAGEYVEGGHWWYKADDFHLNYIVNGEIPEALGDIMISIERVMEHAEEYGHSFERELAYMVVHGFYHLMGEDHIEEKDKVKMREKEEFVLNKLNILRI